MNNITKLFFYNKEAKKTFRELLLEELEKWNNGKDKLRFDGEYITVHNDLNTVKINNRNLYVNKLTFRILATGRLMLTKQKAVTDPMYADKEAIKLLQERFTTVLNDFLQQEV